MEPYSKQPTYKPTDIIDSCVSAYAFLWTNRAYVLRLISLLFLIKFASSCLIDYFEVESVLQSVLCHVPGFILEGWVLAQILRTAILGQYWPVNYVENNQINLPLLAERSRAIKVTVILYTLIQLLLGGILYASMEFYDTYVPSLEDGDSTPPPISPIISLLCMCGFVAVIWAYRFIYLYIPATCNCSMKFFTKNIGMGFWTSVRIIGALILCTVPAVPIMIITYSILNALFESALGEDAVHYLISLIGVFVTLITTLAVHLTLAISYKDTILQGRNTSPL